MTRTELRSEREAFARSSRSPYSQEPQDKRNAEIFERYRAGGVTMKVLGKDYGISKQRVAEIIRRGGETSRPGAHWAKAQATNTE